MKFKCLKGKTNKGIPYTHAHTYKLKKKVRFKGSFF